MRLSQGEARIIEEKMGPKVPYESSDAESYITKKLIQWHTNDIIIFNLKLTGYTIKCNKLYWLAVIYN